LLLLFIELHLLLGVCPFIGDWILFLLSLSLYQQLTIQYIQRLQTRETEIRSLYSSLFLSRCCMGYRIYNHLYLLLHHEIHCSDWYIQSFILIATYILMLHHEFQCSDRKAIDANSKTYVLITWERTLILVFFPEWKCIIFTDWCYAMLSIAKSHDHHTHSFSKNFMFAWCSLWSVWTVFTN
jgi:hypothetical protein